MDIKNYTREMADRRFAALETLKTITEWLNATKPTAFLEKGAPVGDDQIREIWRRWWMPTVIYLKKPKPYLIY